MYPLNIGRYCLVLSSHGIIIILCINFVQFKQVTLYQLNCVKKIPGSSSPAKGSPHSTPNKQSGKSPQKPPKSPYQLPPLVAR